MQEEKLTTKSREAIQHSIGVAAARKHQLLEPEHLMVALLEQGDGLVRPILEKMGVVIERMVGELNQELELFPKVGGNGATQVVFSRRMQGIWADADKFASNMGDAFISTEHFLLAPF